MWGYVIAITVGLSSGLAGVLYTNWRSEVLEKRRWERDDALRSYDHRRQAYMGFLSELLHLEDKLVEWNNGYGGTGNFPDPPEDWLDKLHNLATSIRIFGTQAAWIAANDSIEALDNVSTSGSWEHFGTRIEPYLTQIRKDLMVKDD